MNATCDVLITSEQIQTRIRELGREIGQDFTGRNVTLICVLKGAVHFASDLSRAIDMAMEIDFVQVSSYQGTMTSSGQIDVRNDVSNAIEGRDVIVVEDIVDTGLTLRFLIEHFKTKNPASLKVCALLSKQRKREVDVPVDYVGFDIPDGFVVGYGLDFGERYRNLPFVGVLRAGRQADEKL